MIAEQSGAVAVVAGEIGQDQAVRFGCLERWHDEERGKDGFSESWARPGPITAGVERAGRDVAQQKLTAATAELKADSTQKRVASVGQGQCLALVVSSRWPERREETRRAAVRRGEA